jgi:hypothetical protein
LLAGCATVAPRPGALPSAPAARLAAVQANEERIHSLRARFSSVAHVGDSDRSADGVLLVVKPDRFRLRLMLPIGFTVFDYLCVGDQTWVSLPLAGEQERAGVDQFAPFSREDLGQAFLRGPYAFRSVRRCTGAERSGLGDVPRRRRYWRRTILIGRRHRRGGLRRMWHRLSSAMPTTDRSMAHHCPSASRLEYPQRRQSVDIAIDRYEVNPTLSDDLFRPVAGSVQGG